MRSLQDRQSTAQESNTSLYNELLSMTTAKDAFVGRVVSGECDTGEQTRVGADPGCHPLL